MTTYRILDWRLDVLRDKIGKLAKRANKLQLTPIALNILGEETETDAKGLVTIYKLVEVLGDRPILPGGWRLAGVIQHNAAVDGEGQALNLVRALPGYELPTSYRLEPPTCDHCQKERQRKDTFVVQSEAGQWKRVGGQCLRDFLGHKDPQAVAAYLEDLVELAEALGDDGGEEDEDGFWGGGSSEPKGVSLLTWLVYVAASIRLWGWTPKSKATDFHPATADTAWSFLIDANHKGQLFNKRTGAQEYTRDGRPVQVEKEDDLTAKTALAWLQGKDGAWAGENDYRWNLWVLAARDWVTWRETGLAASIVSAYQREMEERLATERAGEGKERGHIGKVGDRLTFTGLTLLRRYDADGEWGPLHIHTFEDEKGNLLVWKTAAYALELGCVYGGKATIKEHSEYKGEKQTVLTRFKPEQEVTK